MVNNQRADVLFMPNDPFKGLSSDATEASRRMGRYYDAQGNRRYLQNGSQYYGQNGQTGLNGTNGLNGQNPLFLNDGIPTAGYSGHVPGEGTSRPPILTIGLTWSFSGLRAFVGKPYGDALRVLKDGQQKPARPPMQ